MIIQVILSCQHAIRSPILSGAWPFCQRMNQFGDRFETFTFAADHFPADLLIRKCHSISHLVNVRPHLEVIFPR